MLLCLFQIVYHLKALNFSLVLHLNSRIILSRHDPDKHSV